MLVADYPDVTRSRELKSTSSGVAECTSPEIMSPEYAHIAEQRSFFMKTGVKEIVGKQIAGVCVAKNESHEPKHQLFLMFADGTHFEIYGNHVRVAGGVDQGGLSTVERYVDSAGGEIIDTYPAM